MMKKIVIPFEVTVEDYRAIFGDSDANANRDDLQTKLDEACLIVWNYANANSTINWKAYAKKGLSEEDTLVFQQAAIYEAQWLCDNNGSFANFSGYSASSNSFTPSNEIKERVISFKAKSILEDNGFLYKGM